MQKYVFIMNRLFKFLFTYFLPELHHSTLQVNSYDSNILSQMKEKLFLMERTNLCFSTSYAYNYIFISVF